MLLRSFEASTATPTIGSHALVSASQPQSDQPKAVIISLSRRSSMAKPPAALMWVLVCAACLTNSGSQSFVVPHGLPGLTPRGDSVATRAVSRTESSSRIRQRGEGAWARGADLAAMLREQHGGGRGECRQRALPSCRLTATPNTCSYILRTFYW